MKNIIAATAIVLMTSTSAMAAAHLSSFPKFEMSESDIRASDFIGMSVYATENEVDENQMAEADSEKEWDDIGDINDIILNRDGSIRTVVVGVGGFLGIGEKDIAVSMDQIKMVREDGNENDFFLVLNTNKEMLEKAPEFVLFVPTDETKTNSTQANNETRMDDTGRRMLRTPIPPIRNGYMEAKLEELTAERLTGARVYDINDEDIGEIDKLIMTNDGKVSRAVIDVGGFIGIGEHPVAVTFDELKVTRDGNWGDVRVYIDASQKELEAQPAYSG